MEQILVRQAAFSGPDEWGPHPQNFLKWFTVFCRLHGFLNPPEEGVNKINRANWPLIDSNDNFLSRSHIFPSKYPEQYYHIAFPLFVVFVCSWLTSRTPQMRGTWWCFRNILRPKLFFFLVCISIGWWRRSLRRHQKVTRFWCQHMIGTRIVALEMSLSTVEFSSVRLHTRGVRSFWGVTDGL
jgi:hypothetical protein